MKNAISVYRTLIFLGLIFFISSKSLALDSLAFEQVLLRLDSEMRILEHEHERTMKVLRIHMDAANLELEKWAGKRSRKYSMALENKIKLMEAISIEESKWDVALLKVRYRRGVDLIRLMYEKVLGLDHHFSGLRTYQHISVLSNPHSYPEFEEVQTFIRKNKNKKYNMRLPALLEGNPFVSTTFTLMSVLLGENGRREKEVNVDKISCILDFTLSMNGDLNTIRNETDFLKNANQDLKKDLEKLFHDYTKVIGYLVPLETCRTNDDWETLFLKLDEAMAELDKQLVDPAGPNIESSRQLVNLEFATQRVSVMIAEYADFIDKGTQYYHKFEGIVSNYKNEEICAEKLPRQFDEMQEDITSTILKFNNTYDLPELQGSRLKNLMFGVSD